MSEQQEEYNDHIVTIGFADDQFESKEVTSDYFPNKIGGNPAWLDLGNVPTKDDLICRKCDHQLTFLLQFYSPWNEYQHTFHRMIYVFCCQNGPCNEYKVYRQQLAKDNKYYNIDQDECKYNEDFKVQEEKLQNRKTLCTYCGCLSTQRCGGCKMVNYCSKLHQTVDWDLGHKEQCKAKDLTLRKRKSPFHYKESLIDCTDTFMDNDPTKELENEPTEFEDEDDYDNDDKKNNNNNNNDNQVKDIIPIGGVTTLDPNHNHEAMDKYNAYLEETGKDDEFSEKTFSNSKDRELAKFKLAISSDKDQVLRYCRDQHYKVLWVSEKDLPNMEEIPKCELCNEERLFEMQILPQLLYFTDIDTNQVTSKNDIDFGVLSIYTCKKSCQYPDDKPFQQEYIFKQNFTK